MGITMLPRTLPGKWAFGLIIAFFIFMGIFELFVLSGLEGFNDTFFGQPHLAIPLLLAGISGAAAFFAGIFGLIWRRERSVLVFLAVLLGLLVIVFIVGELSSTH